MKEEIKFTSLNELYQRLYPAFNTKRLELNAKGLKIREIDLWNYLKETLWAGNDNLSLYDMVSDIMSLDESKFIKYIREVK